MGGFGFFFWFLGEGERGREGGMEGIGLEKGEI